MYENNEDSIVKTEAPPAMRHITRVRLENFQSHADSTINLEPGINLITGSSDAGKSAILRGVNWVLHNKPGGKGFIRHGAGEARVTVTFSDGTTVQRVRGASRNAVLIKKPGGEESAYDKFGTDYPPEVLDALGNPPNEERQGPISYAEQMSPYFLVSLSPTELPRVLAEITRLDDFQDAADSLSKKARERDRQVKQGRERAEAFGADLESFSGLDMDLARQEILDKRAARIGKLSARLKKAREIVTSFKAVMAHGKHETGFRDAAAAILAHAPSTDAARHTADTTRTMRAFMVGVSVLDAELDAAEKSLKAAVGMTSCDLSNRTSALILVADVARLMRDTLAAYKEIMRQGTQSSKERDLAAAQLESLNAEKTTLTGGIVAAGLWCAACERPLSVGAHSHA